MIQTLRITGVAAVAFAGLVLASVLGPVSLIHLDNKSDQRVTKVLDSPGAVERFHDLHGDKTNTGKYTTPPLVRQAESFKDIIDPKVVEPTPTTPVASEARPTRTVKPPVISAKFTLLGTSYSPSNPAASFAYIRTPENTCLWLACGEDIGHLTLKEVRESSVICTDGRQDSEVLMEVVPDRVAMLEGGDAVAADAAPAAPPSVTTRMTSVAPAGASRLPRRPAFRQPPAAPLMVDDSEHEALKDLATGLKRLQTIPGDANKADQDAAIDKLISEFKSSRVSPQETQKLEKLGDEVSDANGRPGDERNRELMKRLNSSRASKD
jgi:hypothetical protein